MFQAGRREGSESLERWQIPQGVDLGYPSTYPSTFLARPNRFSKIPSGRNILKPFEKVKYTITANAKEMRMSLRNFLEPKAYATPKNVRDAVAIYPAGSRSII
jgi:hypothetical protein